VDRELIDRVARRYASVSARMYAKGKLGSDPIAAQMLALAAELGGTLGRVVDVGCGRGQMGLLALEAGVATEVTGFDWDAKKVAEANQAAATEPALAAKFTQGDVREHPIAAADTLLMFDVLHYLTDVQQAALVDRIVATAPRTILVRELDPDRGWRSFTTRTQEAVTTFLGYNVGERVRVRAIADVTRPLEAAGWSVRVEPSWGSTPFANVAIIARRA
jgi:trans-aconitate methyltransferase